MTLRVLFVCTGNICRSPVAQRLFDARVPADLAVGISAGTRALVGHPIDGPSALALRELGVDSTGHEAQRVSPALTDAADLILTAETEHRSVLLQQQPLLFRRAFTMREFARLAKDVAPPGDGMTTAALRAQVSEVAAQRGLSESVEPGGDDIGDPFGGTLDDARRCVAMLRDCVEATVRALGLANRST